VSRNNIQSLNQTTQRQTKVVRKIPVPNITRPRAAEPSDVESALKSPKTDYDYFGRLVTNAQTGNLNNVEEDLPVSIKRSTDIKTKDATATEIVSDNNRGVVTETDLARSEQSKIKLAVPKKSFNLAAYVNESETLSNLVKLGVDLSKIDEDVENAEYLVKLNFETGVQPYLLFLHKMGVSDGDVGSCITRNPGIFRETLDDLDVRVNYLEMKKFPRDAVTRVIVKAPAILSRTVKQIDSQLGFLQKLFLLTGTL